MEAEVTNGASETNNSSTAVLSRKGLFGKSGVLGETFDTSITIEQDPVLFSNDTPNRDNEEPVSTSSSNVQEVSSSNRETEVLEEQSEKCAHETASTDVEAGRISNIEIETEVLEGSEQCADEDATSNVHEAESKVADVPFVKESTDPDCKEEDKSDIGSDTQDQNSSDKIPDDATENLEALHHDDHEISDNDKIDDEVDKSAQNDMRSSASPDDKLSPGEDGIDELNIAEEICVKKIISMDTDDAEKDKCDTASPSTDVEMEEKDIGDINHVTVILEKSAEDERVDDLPVENLSVEGGPPMDVLQESSSKSEEKDVVVHDIGKDGGNQTDEESTIKTEDIDEVSDQNLMETKAETPKRRSSTRHTVTTVQTESKTPSLDAASGKKAKSLANSKGRNGRNESALKLVENVNDDANSPAVVNENEDLTEKKSLRSRSRRLSVKDTVKVESSTSSQKKGKRNVKLDFETANKSSDGGQESHSDHAKKKDESFDRGSSRRSFRKRSAKASVKNEDTPKSDARNGRSSKDKSKVNTEKESMGSQGAETPRRRKKDIKKSDKSPKTISKKQKVEKQESHDPYDIETEMEKHPEPLKNIHMEVQSFGEVKYAKVGSGKYERTEKTAELRVGNLADMTPRTKQRKSLADLTPGRKKITPVVVGSNTAPQPRRSRKSKVGSDEEPMEVDKCTVHDSDQKKKTGATTPKSAPRPSAKRRSSPQTSATSCKRPHIVIPDLSADDLLAVDHPSDEHAPYEPGARVYAMFDGLFYPAIVVSRDGLGRFKVNFVEDDIIKDVPPAGVIPLRALDRDKNCYSSVGDQKYRLAARVVSSPDDSSALVWLKGEFELEQLDEEGEPSGKKFIAAWTRLALSKEDWRDYINKKSREATDVITDNIESTEVRQLRRSKTTPSKVSATTVSKPSTKVQKLVVKAAHSSKSKSSSKSGILKNENSQPPSSKLGQKSDGKNGNSPGTGDEQIFAGKLFILTSANRPNTDTGFKKKFMTDFISTHGGLVVDDMKDVDEHPNMERFLVSDTHYRTHKYLAALVRAMPCVSHEWIYKCLNEKKLVDYKPFLLPSGVSILDEKEYPLPKKRGVLLRNKKVMVHSNVIPPSKKSMSFEQIWVPMVPQLGGEIVTDIPDEKGKLDILLTDHSATASMVEKARKIGCAVVSSEWLIQGIIMDRLPDVNAHHKFLHNGGVYT